MAEVHRAALDEMIAFATEGLLSGDKRRKRALVRDMAEKWPKEPALALVYAVTSAAEAIEASDQKASADRAAVPVGYRIAALISADIHAVQSMGLMPSLAGDLLHFWRRVDPHFLRLN